MVCGCLGRVGYSLVLNIRQDDDPGSSASRVRVGNTSCLLPRCRGCSPCSAVVTHWSPLAQLLGQQCLMGVFEQHFLVRLVQELLFSPKTPLSLRF